MSQLFRLRVVMGAAILGVALTSVAEASRVRGTIEDLEVEVTGKVLGFTRTRVAVPAEAATRQLRSIALFLAVKDGESLPISPPTEHQNITIEGLRFSPNIASCASDAQVSFVNADREPVTLTIDGAPLDTIPPGEQKTYVCSPGKPVRDVRVVEWPHMRAMVYVGEVGVAGLVNDRGRFTLEAPKGLYELRVVSINGVASVREVRIENSGVDLGRFKLGSLGGAPVSDR